MKLFEKMMEDCTMVDKKTVPDGVGGFSTEWTDGATFKAAIVKNNTLEAKIAEKSGVTEVYTVTVYKGTQFIYHDVFRRESDGAIFRITSNSKDSESPSSASFQIAQASAERWDLK